MAKVKKKRLYQARYIVDVIVDEWKTPGDRFRSISPEVLVKKEKPLRNLTTGDWAHDGMVPRLNHIEKYFSDQLETTFGLMWTLEGGTLGWHDVDLRGVDRELSIDAELEILARQIRKRMPVRRGRRPNAQKQDFLAKKEIFITGCISFIRFLQANNIRVTKKAVAVHIIGLRCADPKRELLRKLVNFEIDFDWLKQRAGQ